MSRARRFPALVRGTAPVPPAVRRVPGADAQALLPLADPAPRTRAATRARELWFCACLPYLPLEALCTASAAFAVVEEQQGVHRIVFANAAAVAAGVAPGMSSNAALALLPELALEVRRRSQEQQALEHLAGWLEQFSSRVSLAADDVLLFEIAGSLRLFGGLKSLRRQVTAGLRQLGFTAALAIAPTPLAATWLARAGHRVCVRSPDNLAAALRDLPLACLDWPAGVVEALTGIGVTRVGACLRLPREGFARRFGAGRLLELDRALGRLPDPRPGWRAPERFRADIELLEEQSDRELLLAVCNELLERLERFLLSRQLGTQRLDFSFYHLKAAATSVSLGCAQSGRTATRWADLLRLRFERVAFGEPVIAVRLEAHDTRPLETGTARLGFGTRRPQASGVSMTQLAERLGARVGRSAVLGVTTVPDHRPQHAWGGRSLLSPGADAVSAVVRHGAKRPLWMLPEPARLHAEAGRPLHLGPLQFIDGPERLETGWWDDDGIARDYYTAVNPRGMRLWVFRDRRPCAGWYLHGFFG